MSRPRDLGADPQAPRAVERNVSRSSLQRIFSALADLTRRSIVARLTAGRLTVGELAAPFAISLAAISRHLKVLERASDHSGRRWSASLVPSEPASIERRLTRFVDSPRETAFNAWINPAQLARWLGPDAIAVEIERLEARPGGAYRIRMRRRRLPRDRSSSAAGLHLDLGGCRSGARWRPGKSGYGHLRDA